MNATARDFRLNSSADTNGLDDLFICEPVPTGANGCQAPVPGADLCLEPVLISAEPVPIDKAATALGYSLNALKKQLRKGTIRGFKRQTKHGEKWFVDSAEMPIICEPVPTSANECQAPVPGADLCLEPVPIDRHLEVIKELQSKIEILTYRNGYLEAQLETEREQIKLLTDSQHKPAWWRKLLSLIRGGQ